LVKGACAELDRRLERRDVDSQAAGRAPFRWVRGLLNTCLLRRIFAGNKVTSMPIKLTEVPEAFRNPPLYPRAGSLQPTDPNLSVRRIYELASWQPSAPFRVDNFMANAYLYPATDAQQPPWLVTIVFLDDAGKWGFWKTFRVDFPDGAYHESCDDELKTALQSALVSGP
jgi:hypothetical protein